MDNNKFWGNLGDNGNKTTNMRHQRIIIKIYIIIFFISISCFSFSDESCKMLSSKDPLTKNDFQIIRIKDNLSIRLDQKYSEISDKLGKLISTNIKPNSSSEKWDLFTYKYDSLIIKKARYWEEILYISVRDNTFKTLRGIMVGDNEEKVRKKYSNMRKLKNGILYLSFSFENNFETIFYTLLFVVKEREIIQIVVSIAVD